MSLFYFGHLNNRERLWTLGKGTLGRACDTSWQGGRNCSPGFSWVSRSVYLSDCPWLWGRGNDVNLLWSPHFLPSQNLEWLLAAVTYFLTGWVWSFILPSKLYWTQKDLHFFFFFCRFYLFIFFREEGREKESERNIVVQDKQRSVASLRPPPGDLVCNPGMCPDWELNWRPLGLQASTRSTEPHQPGCIWTSKRFSSKETLHLGYRVRRQGYLEDWSAKADLQTLPFI